MKQSLKEYYDKHPLALMLIAGAFFRMLAVIFAKGFGWIDDQFLIVEVAQSWVDGTDYYKWLPDTPGNEGPVKFSFFYTGIVYYLLSFLETIGITSPQGKMYFVRFVHAAWSMLIISLGYKITLQLSNKKNANTVGWMLAMLWLFPFLSVRTLVEFVSIPFLLWAILLVIDSKTNQRLFYYLLAGVLLGIAFSIRLQTALITGGMGLVFLFERKWLKTIVFGLGFLLSLAIFQGLIDYYFWGYPFAQLIEYVSYNMHSAANYTVGPWYIYLLLFFGILIPPLSVMLLTGFVFNWRKTAIIFVPVIIFLLFHSYYPNKQERFVITVIPMIIILGVIGWDKLRSQLNSQKWNNFSRYSFVFFWVLNFIVLIPVTLMYSKKARVESMEYLSAYKQMDYFLIEDVHRGVLRAPPLYYTDNWPQYDSIVYGMDVGKYAQQWNWDEASSQPDFVLFFQPINIDKRVSELKQYLPNIVYDTTIRPGNADRFLHWLNPINANENIYIYRNEMAFPKVEN